MKKVTCHERKMHKWECPDCFCSQDSEGNEIVDGMVCCYNCGEEFEVSTKKLNPIQQLKKDHILTARDIAEKVGVSRQTVAGWCSGYHPVGKASKLRIKQIFGVEV